MTLQRNIGDDKERLTFTAKCDSARIPSQSEEEIVNVILTLETKVKSKIQLGTILKSGEITNKPQWKTSDKKIAAVSTNGIVNAKKRGTAVITAVVDNVELDIKVIVK